MMQLPAYIVKSEQIIKDLALNEADYGKFTLDIGAGDSFFAYYLELSYPEYKDNIISLDFDANGYYQMHKQNVEADVESLPFDDETFEQIISYQAFPFLFFTGFLSSEERDDIGDNFLFSSRWLEKMKDGKVQDKMKNSFLEILRVLKVGGRFLACPIQDNDNVEVFKIFNNCLRSILEKLKTEGKIEYDFVKVDEGTDYDGNQTNILRLEIQKLS
jgi:ubiquinone/menaquinone biosynthesis C-methylase UbiE